jgi:hypothetical protein
MAQFLCMSISTPSELFPCNSRCFRYLYFCLPLSDLAHTVRYIAFVYNGCGFVTTDQSLVTRQEIQYNLRYKQNTASTHNTHRPYLATACTPTLHWHASTSTRTRHAASAVTSHHASCAIRQDPQSTQSIVPLQLVVYTEGGLRTV